MNSNNPSSLDEQIDRYTRQLLNQYAQSAATARPQPVTPPPVTVPPAAPVPPRVTAPPPAIVPPPAPVPTPVIVPPLPPAAPTVTPADEFRRYTEENPQRGILRVQTLTSRNTFPVPGVKVIISKLFESGEHVIAVQETDDAGKTEGVLLPAPDRSLSEHPGASQSPFATYKLTVSHPDFATIVALRLPVFAGESSMQVFNMIPLAASPQGDTIQYITTEPSDL